MKKFDVKTLILLIVSIFGIFFTIESHSKTIKVMVIDTGTDLSHKEIKSHVREPWSLAYSDDDGHGTAIAGLVLKDTCSDIELIGCRYRYPWTQNYIEASNECFKRALNEGIEYINYSSFGPQPDKIERSLVKQLTKKGVIIAVAAGNNSLNLMKTGKCQGSFPACYLFKNLYVIQNITEAGYLHLTSNFLTHPNARSVMGVNIPIMLPYNQISTMTGTSPATAKYTNSLLLRRCWELKK